MRVSDSIARALTKRRGLVWCGVAALAVGCLAILITRMELDSDAMNMLPARFQSVQGIKIYDREFEQTREAALKSIRTERKLLEISFDAANRGPFT